MSTTRQIGTAIGVAVIGSLLVSGYQASLSDRVRGLGLSRADVYRSRSSLGAALEVAQRVGGGAGRALADGARHSFIHGMHLGLVAAAVLLIVGGLLAWRYLPARTHVPGPGVAPEL